MGMEQAVNSWQGLIATSMQRGGNGASRGARPPRGESRASLRRDGPPRRSEPSRRAVQRIVVLAEPGLFADGLARSLRTLGAGAEVRSGRLHDAASLLAHCSIAIVDLDGTADVQQTLEAVRARTQAQVVALARSQDPVLLDAAMRAGAAAILSKDCTEAQMLEQVSALMLHGAPSAPTSPTPSADAGAPGAARETRPYGLTPGEMDVLRLLREGLTNAQIARERSCKEGTVKIHLDKIYKKLAVQNRTQAICIASRMDSLIDLQARRLEEAEFRFEALSAYVTHEMHREGEVLFAAGEQGDCLFYIQRGRVRLIEPGVTMQEGDLFGEIGIFSPGHARTCTARCDTQVSLFRLSAEKAHRLYIENPRFAYHVVRLIAGRLIADRTRAGAVEANVPAG